jgi:drug/metabolite transporter (DMT)-like permease
LAWLLGVDGSGVDLRGAGLLVAASLSWSIGTVVGQGLQKRGVSTPSLVLGTGMQMLAGGAALLVVSAIKGEWGSDVVSASVASVAGWAYLVVFGSIVGFTAYVWLLTQVSASAVATYAFVNPIVAVLLGWGIAGEALSGRTVSAAGIIVAGVAMIILDGWRERNGAARAGDDVASSVVEDDSHGLPAVGDEGGVEPVEAGQAVAPRGG